MKTCLGVMLLVCMTGCTTTPSRMNGMLSAGDGVDMFYDVRGNGDVAVVFVHCWACNRLFWHQQRDVIAEDYRVVTFDLPGHGLSSANRSEWSIAGLGDDVVRVIDELQLDRVILVGHSMGGPVSLAAAPQLDGRLLGIVFVDTLHNVEFKFPAEVANQWTQGFEQDFEGQMRRGAGSMFPPDANEVLVNWVVVQACQTDEKAAIALMRDFPNLDQPAMMSAAGVPMRGINARSAVAMPTAIDINRKYGDYDARFIDGAGHYLQLEQPDQFNAHLQAILLELSSSSR